MISLQYQVLIVGTGGTGGYLSSAIAQEAAINDSIYKILLIDGDKVEEKNILRQPFFEAEIGEFKSTVLARKLSYVYPTIRCLSFSEYITEPNDFKGLIDTELVPIIIGCVDNAHARLHMHNFFYEYDGDIIYIDSGNEEWYGNIKLGMKTSEKILSKPIGEVFPDLLDTSKSVAKEFERCSNKIVSGKQNAATNQMAAVIIRSIFHQLLNGIVVSDVVCFDSKEMTVDKVPALTPGESNQFIKEV